MSGEEEVLDYEVQAEISISAKGVAQPKLKIRYVSKAEALQNVKTDATKILKELDAGAKAAGYTLAREVG